jgi:hypothetical protein
MAMKASDLPEYYNAVDILERNLSERADKVALHSLEREMTLSTRTVTTGMPADPTTC